MITQFSVGHLDLEVTRELHSSNLLIRTNFLFLCRFSSVSYSHVSRAVGGSKSVIDQHKAEPSPALPPSSKIVAGSITPKTEPQALQPTASHSAVQKEAGVIKNAVEGAVVKEESAGKSAVPSKAVPENASIGKKKPGATGGASSLANLWGKAPAKVKAATPPVSEAKPALVTGMFFCA